MSAIAVRFRADLRRRWRAWVGLAVLIGLAGGGVTALAAGARRTETVYERFLARSSPSDLLVLDPSALNPEAEIDLAQAAALPGVADSALLRGLFAFGGRADGREIGAFVVVPYSGPPGPLGDELERGLVIDGRRADPAAVDEVVVSYEAARRLDLEAGSTLELDLVRAERLLPAAIALLDGLADRIAGQDTRPLDMGAIARERRYRFTVVGVESSPMDFPPVPATLQPIVYVTPAFHAATGRRVAGNGILVVRLDPGTSAEQYKATLEAINEGQGVTYAGGGVERSAAANRSIDLQAQALWLLAGLVALAGVVIVAQVLARQVVLEADDHTALGALGMSRRQLWAGGVLRAAAIAAVAVGVVVLVAMAVSPAFPIGTAAAAEPDPGLRLDPGAVVVGTALTALLTLSVTAVAEWRRLARKVGEPGRRLLPRWTGRLPLTLHLGGRLALDSGRGRTAVPVRSTLAALSMAVAAAALSVTFVASLDHLTHTPRLYGWDWDLQIGGVAVPDISGPLIEGLQANPAVENVAIGTIYQLELEGRRVDGYALDDVQGAVSAAVIEGRAPVRPDEIALGTVTLQEAGLAVGDPVAVGAGGRTVDMKIVGRSVFPNLGDAGQLGRGARLTFAGLERIAPGSLRNLALVDFAAASDPEEEEAALRRALDVYPIVSDQPPDDLVNFGSASTFPAVVIVTLALVTGATLLHTLVTSIRRRRPDLAVLKTLGLSRGQIGRTVATQATVLTGAALLVGLPIGVAAGRSAWTLVAGRYGFPADPSVPVGFLLVLVAAVVVFANLVAWGPAWTAGRTPAARVLRAE